MDFAIEVTLKCPDCLPMGTVSSMFNYRVGYLIWLSACVNTAVRIHATRHVHRFTARIYIASPQRRRTHRAWGVCVFFRAFFPVKYIIYMVDYRRVLCGEHHPEEL